MSIVGQHLAEKASLARRQGPLFPPAANRLCPPSDWPFDSGDKDGPHGQQVLDLRLSWSEHHGPLSPPKSRILSEGFRQTGLVCPREGSSPSDPSLLQRPQDSPGGPSPDSLGLASFSYSCLWRLSRVSENYGPSDMLLVS